MNKNFAIKDAVIFEFGAEIIDLRGDCELVSVNYHPGEDSLVKLKWSIDGSNQNIEMVFSAVENFMIKGRDSAYPQQSGVMLAIAGFTDGTSCGGDDKFYLDASQEMNYMSFLMDDMSTFLIKSESATIRRV